MKSLGLLLLMAILFSSCSIKTIPKGKPITKDDVPAPYVKPLNGIKVNAKDVYQNGNNIIADNKKFPMLDVQSFSTGYSEYYKTKRSKFAVKVYSGDINIFSINSAQTNRPFKYYFQTNTSPTLMVLNYKNIKNYIKPSEPAYAYLQKSHFHTIIGNSIMFSSTLIFALAINTMLGNNMNSFGDGFHIFLGGVGVYIGGAIFKVGKGVNLNKSLGIHNNSWSPESN